jgi:hypothetical protein
MSFDQEESTHSFLQYRPYPSIYSQMLQVLDVILAVLPLTHEGYHLGKFLPSGKNVYLYGAKNSLIILMQREVLIRRKYHLLNYLLKKAWIISNFYFFNKSIH